MARSDFRQLLRSFAQPVTYLGLGMLLFIWAALACLLVADRNTDYEQARRRAENFARIFDQSFSNIFHDVDARLLFVRKLFAQNSENFDLAFWVRDPSIRNYPMVDFGVLDTSGHFIHATYSKSAIGLDRSDREYFRVHLNTDRDELFISEPLTVTPSQRTAIILSRRIAAADGTFLGVVTALLNPNLLGQQATTLDLGQDGAVTLRGLDGVIRLRAINGTFDWNSVGRRLPPGVGRMERLKGAAAAGAFWNGSSIVDNISRLIAFRRLESVPMVAVVGIAEAEVFRRANENARIYFAIALLLSAAILAAIALGAKRERKLMEATSEMKAAQEALQQSQERYRLVESAVNDGIWDRNLLTGETYRSPRWRSILGYSDDDVLDPSSCFHDLLHPDDRASVAEAMRAHLEEDKPYACDSRLRCRNGDYKWVHNRGRALRDGENRPVRMVGTISDISERKLAESLIEESRNNLARAEAMALLGHYKYELGSGVHTWSAGAYRIFGKSEDFITTPESILRLIHPDDRHILEQHRRDLRAGIDTPAITVRAERDDGKTIYVRAWSAAVRGSDGSVIGTFGTLQDVTDLERAKEAMARVNQELERRVAERTAELAREMRGREQAQMTLAQVQKMEAVGQLTAGIAHDFNNLLAVIRGGLEFIDGAAARGLTAEPELIDASLRATRRGSELVRRLLAFSRQSPLRAEPTSINQLVLDTLRLLQRTLGEGIEIVTQLDALGAAVCVDRNQLANALMNLALNARDAMPDGGELTIATACRPARWVTEEGSARWPTGEEVCITVSDTGIGMSEQTRNRAFEPFFTTKRDGLGTGLGLSMVHGFVEQSGGHIEIDSAAGRGTTVTIRLPRIEAACQTDEPDAFATAAAKGQEKTVLLVEDDPDVRVVTAAQLRHLGYRVHAVANGIEAIDLIGSPANIDITLTDIVLPGGIDGVALLKEAMRSRPEMGVLCMSGYDPTHRHRRWLMVQNIHVLEKPFSCGRLAEALESALVR